MSVWLSAFSIPSVLLGPCFRPKAVLSHRAMVPGEEHQGETVGEVMERRRREGPRLDGLSLAVLHLLADDLLEMLGSSGYFDLFSAIEDLLPEHADAVALAVFIE